MRSKEEFWGRFQCQKLPEVTLIDTAVGKTGLFHYYLVEPENY